MIQNRLSHIRHALANIAKQVDLWSSRGASALCFCFAEQIHIFFYICIYLDLYSQLYAFLINNQSRQKTTVSITMYLYSSLSRESAKHHSFQLGFYSNNLFTNSRKPNSSFKAPTWRTNVLFLVWFFTFLHLSGKGGLTVATLLPV